MARHDAIYMQWLDYTSIEQRELIQGIWGAITAITRAMLVDGNLPEEYWEEASRYATFIYNHLPLHGKGADGKAFKSPQESFYDTCITVQGRKRKHRRSHPVWMSRF